MTNTLIIFFSQAWVLSSAIALFCAWCVWLLFRFIWFLFGERASEKQLALTRIQQYQENKTLLYSKKNQKPERTWFTKTVQKVAYLQTLETDFDIIWPEKKFERLLQIFILLFFLLGSAGYLAFGKVLHSLFSASSSCFLLLFIHIRANKERNKLSIQLPDTLDALSNAMQAGYSFPQALEFVERESLAPTKYFLNQAVKEMNYNFSMEEVLLNLQQKTKNRDIEFAVQALLMQLSIGGNVSDMMEQQGEIIRERLSLERDMRAATAQGRMSGFIVALLWPISLGLFYLVSPDYISVMFETSVGQNLLLFAILLEAIGFSIIWKITNVKI